MRPLFPNLFAKHYLRFWFCFRIRLSLNKRISILSRWSINKWSGLLISDCAAMRQTLFSQLFFSSFFRLLFSVLIFVWIGKRDDPIGLLTWNYYCCCSKWLSLNILFSIDTRKGWIFDEYHFVWFDVTSFARKSVLTSLVCRMTKENKSEGNRNENKSFWWSDNAENENFIYLSFPVFIRLHLIFDDVTNKL